MNSPISDFEQDEYSTDHFDEDAWDELCRARLEYKRKIKGRRNWYIALRRHCGYTGGDHRKLRFMGKLVDMWLDKHPTWVRCNTRDTATET